MARRPFLISLVCSSFLLPFAKLKGSKMPPAGLSPQKKIQIRGNVTSQNDHWKKRSGRILSNSRLSNCLAGDDVFNDDMTYQDIPSPHLGPAEY